MCGVQLSLVGQLVERFLIDPSRQLTELAAGGGGGGGGGGGANGGEQQRERLRSLLLQVRAGARGRDWGGVCGGVGWGWGGVGRGQIVSPCG